jgi:low temperature requirement protein LtrA
MSITPLPWSVPMGPRDTEEPHRAATPLELFFDLVFVVAIAAAAAELHHGLAEPARRRDRTVGDGRAQSFLSRT